MNIRIATTLPADTLLFSTSELLCALNAAESRFTRAVRDNEITPLGTMGRVTVFAVTPDELERLRRTLGRSPGG